MSGATYRITAIDQSRTFAGRLGQRVETVLRLQGSTGERQVRLTRMHTRVAPLPTFRVGDEVAVPEGAVVAAQDVRVVRTESRP